LTVVVGCKSTGSSGSSSSSSNSSTNNNSGGGSTSGGSSGLTASSLTGTWKSSCLAFTPNTTGSGVTYHQIHITFQSGTDYFYYDDWYDSSGCGGSSWALELSSAG